MVQRARNKPCQSRSHNEEFDYVNIPPYRELIFIDPAAHSRDEMPQNWHLRD